MAAPQRTLYVGHKSNARAGAEERALFGDPRVRFAELRPAAVRCRDPAAEAQASLSNAFAMPPYFVDRATD